LNNNAYDELAVQKGDCKINSIKEIEIKQEANKIERLTPPISFLTDTSIDTYYENRSNSEKYQKTIDKFIKDLNFQASFIKTNIMAQFCEICFEVDGQTAINEILRKQAELLQQLKISSYNITFKGNIIKFEIPNKKISKISLRNIFNTTGDISSNKAIAGMDLENNPLLLDFNKHNNALIVGMKGSGGAMVLTTTLISLAYTNRPFDLSFIMISVYGDKSLKQFNDLPHLTSPVITEIDDAIIKLHEVIEIINDRKNRFKDAGASTLEEFNKYQTSDALKLKSIVLVISSFDKIIKMSLQNTEILSTILEDGNKYGVNTILLSTNINTEVLTSTIYDNCNAKFILRLESEQESLKVFDSYRGIQLFGNGDGFFIDAKAQKKTRFQSCYMNIKELDEIINIIKKFYAIKETQI
jgi:S-DNA-T family DNA segregation ATPase FtsK/SpoIIIE